MSLLPTRNDMNYQAGGAGGTFTTAILAFFDAVLQLIGIQPATELTIAAGIVTPTRGSHTVDTEADAAADDLTHIVQTNMPDGFRLTIRAVDAARVPTAKHAAAGAGQMLMVDAADFVLDAIDKFIVFERRGTDWQEIERSFGNDMAGYRSWIATIGATDDGSGLTGTSVKAAPAVIKTVNSTLLETDAGKTLIANKATAITFDLPPLAGLSSDVVYFIRNIGAGDLAIDGNGGEMIDGATIKVLLQDESCIIVADTANTTWRTLAAAGASGGGKLVDWAHSPFGSSASIASTTVVAYQDTGYTSAQGAAFTPTISYTPTSTANYLRISLFVNWASDVSNASHIALFYNAVTPAVKVWFNDGIENKGRLLQHVMQAPLTSSMTFKARVSTTWSGSAIRICTAPTAAQDFGGMNMYFWLVEEFAP